MAAVAPPDSPRAPTVSIVVAPRERFSQTRATLEALYRSVARPFDLIYVDGGAPPRIARWLDSASRARGFRLLRPGGFLAPNQARNLGLAEVRTEFAVCIDNDVEPEPGWLDRLLQCAAETGAWAVAPLYLEGTPGDGIIHMAGGIAHFVERDGVRTFESRHVHAQRRVADVAAELRRHEAEMFEFHCVLLRMDEVRPLLPLDEGLLSNHEHLDLSLLIREAGGSIWMEPAVKVTYLRGPLDRHDLRYATLRWSDDWNRRSARRFAQKWRLPDDWGAAEVAWGNEQRRELLTYARTPSTVARSRLGRAARALLGTPVYTRLRRALRRAAP